MTQDILRLYHWYGLNVCFFFLHGCQEWESSTNKNLFCSNLFSWRLIAFCDKQECQCVWQYTERREFTGRNRRHKWTRDFFFLWGRQCEPRHRHAARLHLLLTWIMNEMNLKWMNCRCVKNGNNSQLTCSQRLQNYPCLRVWSVLTYEWDDHCHWVIIYTQPLCLPQSADREAGRTKSKQYLEGSVQLVHLSELVSFGEIKLRPHCKITGILLQGPVQSIQSLAQKHAQLIHT